MNVVLFDGPERPDLLPFTFTRPVADIRVGIWTLREKWEHFLDEKTTTKTEAYLAKKWPLQLADKNVFINPAFLPSNALKTQVIALNEGEKLVCNNQLVAFVFSGKKLPDIERFTVIEVNEQPLHIQYSWDIFAQNSAAIVRDFEQITAGRVSAQIPDSVFTVNKLAIFIEPGAKLLNCSLNAEEGPIYIGKEAEIMEGAHLRGPFAMGKHSYIKMGAKIYGGTTLGPHCKVGGEVSNSVLMGFSNKGHDGFLGNAVLGEWCNIGADSNNSNLKNNYAEVKLWNYIEERFVTTGLQFCGLMMGDHSKCGINTMFNTGTVVGVSANIFGTGFPRNFVPSFSWGGSNKMITYKPEKVFEVAQKVMQRRQVKFTEEDCAILQHVFEITQNYRRA